MNNPKIKMLSSEILLAVISAFEKEGKQGLMKVVGKMSNNPITLAAIAGIMGKIKEDDLKLAHKFFKTALSHTDVREVLDN